MHYQTEAIIISKIKYSETSLIVSFLSSDKGVFKAMVRGGINKKNMNLYELGNLVNVNLVGKSDDKLGIANSELITTYYTKYFTNKTKLLSLSTAIEMVKILFPIEEENYVLFNIVLQFLNKISDDDYNLYNYLEFELTLLELIGIGLNLKECVVTGKKKDLYYVSPKSGHVVTLEAGKKYHDKLLIIPQYLIYHNSRDYHSKDLNNGKIMTEYFFTNLFLNQINKRLPKIRDLLFNEELTPLS